MSTRRDTNMARYEGPGSMAGGYSDAPPSIATSGPVMQRL